MAAAKQGILVDDSTYELCKNHPNLHFSKQEPFKVKGKSNLITVNI